MAGLNIFAKLGLDAKGFKAGAEQARQTAGKMKKHIGKEFGTVAAGFAGMFAAAYVGSQIRETIDYAAKVRDLGNVFGMTTDQVQKLDYAATQSGITIEEVMDAHKDLGKSMSEALADEGGGKAKAFEALAVSVDEIKGKNIDEVFMRVAKSIHESGPILEPEQVKAIEDLMGGAGFKAINMMRGDLEAVFQNLEDIGGIIDAQAIAKLGAVGDAMAALKTQNRSTWADMLGFMSNAWMAFVNGLTASIDELAHTMVGTWDAMKKFGTGFSAWYAGLSGRAGGNKELGKKLMGEAKAALASKELSGAFFAERATQRVKKKEKELADRIALAKKEDAAARKGQAVMDVEGGRSKIAEKMAQLADEDEKRRFGELSLVQQLLHLEMKLAGERAKMAKMPALHTEKEIEAAVAGLEALPATEKRKKLEQENLDRTEQAEALRVAGADVAAKKAEKDKQAPVAMAGEATYSALARIGGARGGRNPILDMSKKQFQLQQTQAQRQTEMSQSLNTIAGR